MENMVAEMARVEAAKRVERTDRERADYCGGKPCEEALRLRQTGRREHRGKRISNGIQAARRINVH